MDIFTNEGEFRVRGGKGTKKSRLGPRIMSPGAKKAGAERQTPDEIAFKILSKIAHGLNVNIGFFQGRLKNAEQLRFMNMNILAHVLLYIQNNTQENEDGGYIAIDREHISEAIRPIMDKEVNNVSEDDRSKISIRLSFTFVRYIRYVSSLPESVED